MSITSRFGKVGNTPKPIVEKSTTGRPPSSPSLPLSPSSTRTSSTFESLGKRTSSSSSLAARTDLSSLPPRSTGKSAGQRLSAGLQRAGLALGFHARSSSVDAPAPSVPHVATDHTWNDLMKLALGDDHPGRKALCNENPGMTWQGELKKARGQPLLEQRNGNGHTALMIAAINGRADMATIMQGAGADPMAVCPRGRSAVSWATAFGQSGSLTSMLRKMTSSQRKQLLDRADVAGNKPIHIAARNGQATFSTVVAEMKKAGTPLTRDDLMLASQLAHEKFVNLKTELEQLGGDEERLKQIYGGGDPLQRANDNIRQIVSLMEGLV